MNTFESIEEFVVPARLCDATDARLREAGTDGNERFVLWSGVISGDRLLIRSSHCPKQFAIRSDKGVGVHVGGTELHRLNVWLHANAERLAVQVHSHPSEAFHSDIDDTYPMVTTLGGLSLVVPDFAKNGVRGPGTALYRLESEGWRELPKANAKKLLRLEG